MTRTERDRAGGDAFASENEPGMTLRDWFAGQALSGLMAADPNDRDEYCVALDAYRFAAAMLSAREATQP